MKNLTNVEMNAVSGGKFYILGFVGFGSGVAIGTEICNKITGAGFTVKPGENGGNPTVDHRHGAKAFGVFAACTAITTAAVYALSTAGVAFQKTFSKKPDSDLSNK